MILDKILIFIVMVTALFSMVIITVVTKIVNMLKTKLKEPELSNDQLQKNKRYTIKFLRELEGLCRKDNNIFYEPFWTDFTSREIFFGKAGDLGTEWILKVNIDKKDFMNIEMSEGKTQMLREVIPMVDVACFYKGFYIPFCKAGEIPTVKEVNIEDDFFRVQIDENVCKRWVAKSE